MNTKDSYYFSRLKKAVSQQFLRAHNAPDSIEDWKGDDIIAFQEDLFDNVRAKVSEKWFYSYFKNNPNKLPRIDMLNLLSNYVGYKNWHAFKKAQDSNHTSGKTSSGSILKLLLLVIPIAAIFFYNRLSKNNFEFCFVDEYKEEPITSITLDIKILQKDESPIHLKSSTEGCFEFSTNDKEITFIVQSPFHKTDTIVRQIKSFKNNIVRVQPDDYALMLDYYTNGNVEDHNKRKAELGKLIADDAMIYEMFKNNIGVEIYSKEAFIGKITTPTKSLRKIRILDKTYKDDRIVKLKFMVE